MAGRTLGDAWVTILPDTSAFRAKLDSDLRKAMAGLKPTVKVTVELNQDTAKLRTQLQTNLSAASKGLKANVGTDVDMASLAKAKAVIAAATKPKTVKVEALVDPATFTKLEELRDRMTDMIISTNDSQAEKDLNTLDARAEVLALRMKNIKTDLGVAGAIAQMAALDAAVERVKNRLAAKTNVAPADLGLNLALAKSQFTHLEQSASDLRSSIDRALSPSGITIGKVTKDTEEDLKGLRAGAASVYSEIAKLSKTGITSADDVQRVKTLTTGLGSLKSAVEANGVAVTSSSFAWRGWVNALIDIARVQIPLFNGAFTKMLPHFLAFASGTHILVEAALEIVAVWVPAAIALGVFAAAAAKAAYEVTNDTKNMAVAANGTGQAFDGLTKKVGTTMSQLARPYVFEAFGQGLIAMQHQSQTTGQVIQVMGTTINRWISEAVLALQKGTGQMALKGSHDFAILGDAFKQVGTLIEGFIKVTPGYASDLLKLGDAVLHIASVILNSPLVGAFLKIGLAAHGAFFYIGLFVTLGTKLGTMFLRPIASMGLFTTALGKMGVVADGEGGKIKQIVTAMSSGWSEGTGKMVKDTQGMSSDVQKGLAVAFTSAGPITAASKLETVAGTAMTGLGTKVATAAKGIKGAVTGMFSALGINPWLLGIAAVGAAIFGLVMLFRSGTNAAKAFGDAATTALNNSAVTSFSSVMQVQMKAAQSSLANAKAAFSDFSAKVNVSGKATADSVRSLQEINPAAEAATSQLNNLKGSAQAWQGVVNDLNTKQATFNDNLKMISKTAGVDLPTALNLANQAGLTSKQLMGDTGIAAKEDALQVAGLAQGYQSLTAGIGGVKTAYSALNIQNSQTMKDAQQVASAFANFTTLITGGVGAFDTFTQGQATLASNLNATGKAGGTATLSLGKLSDKITLAGANMDKLTPASVTANQAFLQQVNNAQALYGNLVQLAAASGNTATAQHTLSIAGKDMISTLLQTAGGSKEAQTQIFALAQTFGYAGSNTLPQLVKWLGTTGDKTTDLQGRVNALTGAAGNLARAAQALSGAINSDLNAAMSKSIIDAEGGQAAFDKFAKSVEEYGKNASSANLKAVIAQGTALKNTFISAAGSAKAAEPALQIYFQQLGIGKDKAASLANQILGLSANTKATTKPMNAAAVAAEQWAGALKLPVKSVQNLETALGQTDFATFIKKGNNTNSMLQSLASGLQLNSKQSQALWAQFAKSNLEWLSGKTDAAKNSFVKLLGQFGLAPGAANAVWAALQKQYFDQLSAKIGVNKQRFIDLAAQMNVNKGKAADLWNALAKNSFSLLDTNIATNKAKFIDLARQFGITGASATTLWQKIVAQQLQAIVSGNVKTTKQHFIDLEGQLGVTTAAANALWNKLKQAPKVNASVTVTGGVTGQAQAVAQATGAQKQVIGKLFFAQRAKGGPIGMVPGWHNTGDDTVAMSPGGPIALQGGEAIVPKNLSTHPAFTAFAKAKGIPGFQAGGTVPGGLPGSGIMPTMGDNYVNTRTNLANSQITYAGDAIQASKIAAYDALVNAFTSGGGGVAGGVGGSAKAQQILADAEKWNGHRYVWGGASNPTQGWDCSSFVGYILGHDFGMPLPGGTSWSPNVHGPVAAQYNNEPGWSLASHNVNAIQAGDLLVENSGGHVGFGVGPNRMFSAYGTSSGTIYSDAANMTNIYRLGGGSGPAPQVAAAKAGTAGAVVSKDPLTEAMAKAAQKVYASSTAWNILFPPALFAGAPGGNPGSVASGSSLQNLLTIARYLMTQGANAAGAAGIAGTIDGESGGNPESVGSGGFGLIGWTGNTIGLPAGVHGPTGNASADLAAQMVGIVGYARARPGGWPDGFANASDPVSAGALWSQYEAPKSPGSDERPGTAQQIFSMLNGGNAAALGNTIAKLGVLPHKSMGGMIPGFATGGKVAAKVAAKPKPLTAQQKFINWLGGHTQAYLRNRISGDERKMAYDSSHNKAKDYLAVSNDLSDTQAALSKWVNPLTKTLASQTAVYNKLKAEAAKAKSSGNAKNFLHYSQQAADYAQAMAGTNAKLHPAAITGTGAKLALMKPTNDDMRLAEKLMTQPWLDKLISGPGSVSSLGWGMQPVLGQMMIGAAMDPKLWVGQPSGNSLYNSMDQNWTAAMEVVGGFLGANPSVAKLAGAATGQHGKTTGGVGFAAGGKIGASKSFGNSGMVHENVAGVGASGRTYKFHSGDYVTSPTQAKQVNNESVGSAQILNMLAALLQEQKKSNQIAQGTGFSVAKAINGVAGRRVGR